MNKAYEHYIGVDWSITKMAIARMTGKSNKVTVIEVPSDVEELRRYLSNLRGRRILTIEETTVAQWLYTELKDSVERLIICDPTRNRLLSEGAKTDKIDAVKLVQLLRAEMLKEVYHSANRLHDLRRVVSGYDGLVKSGVRYQNQRYSFLRSLGYKGDEAHGLKLKSPGDQLVLEGLEKRIKAYEEEKALYKEEFERWSKRIPEIRHQKSLPGIGIICAAKIVSRVVSPARFSSSGHYLSYAGLVKLIRKSGGVSYGRKEPRYSRDLKYAYKTAMMAAIDGNNEIGDYYEMLINEKNYTEYNARQKAARRLATLSLGVFKSGRKYEPYDRRHRVKNRSGRTRSRSG
ncbi:MAG: transposase [Pseudomonadota bacterium]